jgi:predicted phage-related endonuclease
MIIHTLVQGSPEWLAYRAQHFNASDAPAMMGCSPNKTRAQLLREMHTGLTADVDVDNNVYPRQIIESRIESYKREKRKGNVQRDIMQDSKTKLGSADDADKKDEKQP